MDANQNTDSNENTQTQTNSGNENTSTQTDGTMVSMSQDDFNALIGKKIGKAKDNATNELLESLGLDSLDTLKAQISKQKELEENSKTELEKVMEQMAALKSENESLVNKASEAQRKIEINSLASQNGIKDTEVFELLYNQNASKEDFNSESFIEGLKESKPFLFGDFTPKVKTDKTKNNQNPSTWSERVKNAKNKQELDALYLEVQGN